MLPCFNALFLVRLGLGTSHWLTLGVACLLLIAGSLAWLLLGLSLLQCLILLVVIVFAFRVNSGRVITGITIVKHCLQQHDQLVM